MTYCIIRQSVLKDYQCLDTYLAVLFNNSQDKMASSRCLFVPSVHVDRICGHNYITSPSLVADAAGTIALVDWEQRKVLWRRDGGAKKHYPKVKKARKKSEGPHYISESPRALEDLGL